MLKRFLIALQFLTIVPVRVTGDVSEQDMSASAAYYPLVGIALGVALVLAAIIFKAFLPAGLSVALVLLVLVALTGGFHLDGLADMADGLACKGNREKKLAAMKDSATGPIGVVVIVFALGLKYLALVNISEYNSAAYFFALLVMPVAGRWVMLPAMRHGVPARPDGLGRIFIGAIGGAEMANAAVWSALAVVIPAAFLTSPGVGWQGWMGLASLGVLYGFGVLFAHFCKKHFGGLTGDTLGALGELSEVIYLLAVTTWLGQSL